MRDQAAEVALLPRQLRPRRRGSRTARSYPLVSSGILSDSTDSAAVRLCSLQCCCLLQCTLRCALLGVPLLHLSTLQRLSPSESDNGLCAVMTTALLNCLATPSRQVRELCPRPRNLCFLRRRALSSVSTHKNKSIDTLWVTRSQRVARLQRDTRCGPPRTAARTTLGPVGKAFAGSQSSWG